MKLKKLMNSDFGNYIGYVKSLFISFYMPYFLRYEKDVKEDKGL